MLPPIRKIYINPNFNKPDGCPHGEAPARMARASVAINPYLFRQNSQGGFATPSGSASIHMNPAFLGSNSFQEHFMGWRPHTVMQLHHRIQEAYHYRQRAASSNQPHTTLKSATPPPPPPPPPRKANSPVKDTRKILTKSRTCIIREPAAKCDMPSRTTNAMFVPTPTPTPKPQPIIKLTKRKLVRQHAPEPIPTKKRAVELKPATQQPKCVAGVTAWSKQYKLDRTKSAAVFSSQAAKSKMNVETRYAMRRARLHKSELTVVSLNKKLVNINGVLYKVTRNRLERRMEPCLSHVRASTVRNAGNKRDRRLLVDGAQYVMDASGYKITRVPAEHNECADYLKPRTPRHRRRIDIGGLTYVASTSKHNVFVRTQNHLALAHLTNAKNRSLNFLSRRYTKRNEPCPIYQRLGKCTGYENGTCTMLHDHDLVTICPMFLRGECASRNCLLSHNVSLSKMPVCRFYLQGNCVNTECPFLHKKLGRKANLCEQFQRGFCKLADQCDKRHEFVCPNIDRTGVCNTPKCVYCENAKRWRAKQKSARVDTPTADKPRTKSAATEKTMVRYFRSDTAATLTTPDSRTDTQNESQRMLGSASTPRGAHMSDGERRDDNPNEPSFIPI